MKLQSKNYLLSPRENLQLRLWVFFFFWEENIFLLFRNVYLTETNEIDICNPWYIFAKLLCRKFVFIKMKSIGEWNCSSHSIFSNFKYYLLNIGINFIVEKMVMNVNFKNTDGSENNG